MPESSELKIKGLETQMIYQASETAEIKAIVKDIQIKMASITDLHAEIGNLKDEVTELKQKRILEKWLFPTLSAAVGSAFTFLLIEYVKGIH
jgi:predicted  nucleic acid-binding Zn-ribbon protein